MLFHLITPLLISLLSVSPLISRFKCTRGQLPFFLVPLPKDSEFKVDQIDIIRLLGRVEIQRVSTDRRSLSSDSNNQRVSSLRIFEGRIPGGTRVFLKEYFSEGQQFGKMELSVSRKLSSRWNDLIFSIKNGSSEISLDSETPFSVLLGCMRPDESIEGKEFRGVWARRFPSAPFPQRGSLWLVFKWDDASFKNFKRFPILPQIVEGLDYFRKDQRDMKRWRFIRKIMRRSLEAVDYLHRSGYCHNAVNGASLWMSSTNQQDIDSLSVQIVDLGACQKLADLAVPGDADGRSLARQAVLEDMYQLGFVFLELIVSSFNDDNAGSQIARYRGKKRPGEVFGLVYQAEENLNKQLDQREIQTIFEIDCDSDFRSFREFFRSISQWADTVKILEQSEGAAWRLIFKLLSRGRLYDESKQRPLKITGRGLVKEYRELFIDTST